jgi:hypothetical protein
VGVAFGIELLFERGYEFVSGVDFVYIINEVVVLNDGARGPDVRDEVEKEIERWQ